MIIRKMVLGAVLGAAVVGLPFAASAADGSGVWKANKCARCHGDTGKADTKMGKKKEIADMTTAEWQKEFSDKQIEKAIVEGVDREKNGKKRKMKAYKKLKPDEVEALVTFIRSFAK